MSASAVLESLRSEKKRKMESDAGVSTKKRKTVAKKATVLPQYQGPKMKGVKVETNIFEGMKFVVMSNPKSRTGEEDKKALTKQIYANGGSCAQIANNQPDLFVVYGGTVIPYDLKLIIDKGKADVIKPSWIVDSIEEGEQVPLQKKYFFHATEARTATDEYNMDVDEEDANEPEAGHAGPSGVVHSDREDQPMRLLEDNEVIPKVEEEEVDPALTDWFKVDDDKKGALPAGHEAEEDSVTEDDSDHAGVPREVEEEVDLDDWFKVKIEDAAEGSISENTAEMQPKEDLDIKMGETEHAMEYDQELIFNHLCFYLDSQENAVKFGLSVKSSKHEKEITKNFAELSRLLTDNGGKIVGLDEPKLTHVVIDKRDESRRLELIKRTSKPKRRHLVISEYIQACLDEETLLDEDEFAP